MAKYLITWCCENGSEALGSAPTLFGAIDVAHRQRPHDAVKALIQNAADQVEEVIHVRDPFARIA